MVFGIIGFIDNAVAFASLAVAPSRHYSSPAVHVQRPSVERYPWLGKSDNPYGLSINFPRAVEAMQGSGLSSFVLSIEEGPFALEYVQKTVLSSTGTTTYYPFGTLPAQEQNIVQKGKDYTRLALIPPNDGPMPCNGPSLETVTRLYCPLKGADPTSNELYLTYRDVWTPNAEIGVYAMSFGRRFLLKDWKRLLDSQLFPAEKNF
jgi:hypothetical protein